MHELVDIKRSSTKSKLLHTITWLLKFLENLQKARSDCWIVMENYVRVNEVYKAEQLLIRSIQYEVFLHEIAHLSSQWNIIILLLLLLIL